MVESESESKYTIFLEWCSQNGILFPKVKFPLFFDGLVGIGTYEVIQPNEAILSVPISLLFSTNRARESKIKHIFIDNPDVFDQD